MFASSACRRSLDIAGLCFAIVANKAPGVRAAACYHSVGAGMMTETRPHPLREPDQREPHRPDSLRLIARLIDHTLLKPEATRDAIRKLCDEALKYGFASVCVNPWNVRQAAEILRGSDVRVCTVVGFPLGATLPQVKIYEAEEAIKLGAREIDMVINIGALKSKQDEAVEADIRGVVEASHRGRAIVKVILETALLTTDEKVRGSLAAKNAGADFVKTSTGFGPGGATAEDVRLIRATVGDEIGVKAAGGVRTFEDVQKMVDAGATRIGASASVQILEQARAANSEYVAEVAQPGGAPKETPGGSSGPGAD